MGKNLVLFLLMSISGSVLAEEVYRWVDADGVVNFTQQRPREVTAEQISTRTGGSQTGNNVAQNTTTSAAPQSFPTTAATDEANTMDAAQREMLEGLRAEEARRQIEQASARDANCEKSRGVLARLTGSPRIRVRGTDGVERMMPEEERQERIDDAQTGVANYCTAV